MNFNGVQTSRDSLLVDIDAEALNSKMRAFLETREDLPSYSPWKVLPYIYRPYDTRSVYWDNTPKFLVRPREEYIAGHINSISLVLPKQSRVTYGGPLVTKSLVDLNSVDGGAAVFTLKVVSFSPLHGSSIETNLSRRAMSWIESVSATTEELVYHVIAITHTGSYSKENMGALQRDWPRIPLPCSGMLLAQSASLGRKLAHLLDAESLFHFAAEWSFLARISIPDEFQEGTYNRDPRNAARFAITAGWGSRGQGDTVMPGRGKAPERNWTSTELERLATLAATQDLTQEQALLLLGSRCVDVYLNDDSCWLGVPINVWEYTLGGYQVLKKWLSYREEPLLGRPLHEEEVRYFSQVVRRITAILLLGPALDASYSAILPGARGLSSN
jgi:hypothetical protein